MLVGLMSDVGLIDRMRQGDPSAYLAWAPAPLDEAGLDELWIDAQTRGPRLPTLFYAHIPHCVSSCNFCMYFHRVTQSADTHRATVDHIVGRLDRFHDRVGRVEIAAGYIGGGTPTAMPIELLIELLGAINQRVALAGPLTVEAHPGTTDPAAIASLAAAGVTRLSMGLQSLEPDVLVQITRRNPTVEHLAELLRAAGEAGLERNVDLVVGLPRQTRASFHADLDRLIALRPDSITIYRYHPTRKLPGGELRLEDALGPRQWLTATRAGYLGKPANAGSNAVVLYRVNDRLSRQLAQHLRAAVQPRANVSRYEAFGDGRRHMIGFGSGAIGHVWGRAWVREVTSLDRSPGPALYTATRLTPLDEVRGVLRARIASGSPVHGARLAHDAGVDVAQLLGLDHPELRDALIQLGRWWMVRPGLDEAKRRALLDRWMPDGPATTSEWDDSRLQAAERELVTLRFQPTRGDLVDAFRQLLGIPSKGLRLGNALVVDRDDTGLSFAVGHKQAAPLRLLVSAPEDSRPAFVKTRRFAMSYSVGERELTSEERALIDDLAARLRAADGV